MKKAPNYTYTVSEPDGKSGGPFSFEEMKRRIAEGTVTGSTIIQRNDSTRWATASDFPELEVNDVVVSRYDHENAPDALTQEIEEFRFKRAVRAGAGWFFWIAALSLINAGSAYVASTARLHSAPLIETAPGYALGLSVIYPLGEFGARFGGTGALLALALNIGLVLFYLFCGVAGWKKYYTPYVLGMSFYAGDTALAFLAGDWISTGIHVLALLFLYCGLDALLENRQMTWANGSLLRAGVLAIAVAVGGWGLLSVVNNRPEPQYVQLAPEPWAAKPRSEWPQIVLTHDAKFTGHGELNGASAFLLSLSDTQVVAVTARHLFAWFGSSLPNLKLSLIDGALDTWKLHARNQPAPGVNVAGLLGTPNLYGTWDDIVMFRLEPTTNALPFQPLKLRQNPVKPGEKGFIIGVPYGSDSTQYVYSATIFANVDGILEGYVDEKVEFEGFSGAPVVDQGGHVIGVMTGAGGLHNPHPDRSFSAHAILELDDVLASLEDTSKNQMASPLLKPLKVNAKEPPKKEK